MWASVSPVLVLRGIWATVAVYLRVLSSPSLISWWVTMGVSSTLSAVGAVEGPVVLVRSPRRPVRSLVDSGEGSARWARAGVVRRMRIVRRTGCFIAFAPIDFG